MFTLEREARENYTFCISKFRHRGAEKIFAGSFILNGM
jgi:hypothetical protein